MRVLVIDEDAIKEIQKVMAYAEDHRVDKDTMQLMIEGKVPPVGSDAFFVCYLNDGFRVVYSLEDQPCGWCRHISISVESPEKYPSPYAVLDIMKEFGFIPDFKKCIKVWKDEKTSEEEYNAINVLQTVEPLEEKT